MCPRFAGSSHERLKQSRDGASLYAVVQTVEAVGFAVVGARTLTKWDVASGQAVASVPAGAMGVGVVAGSNHEQGLSQLTVSRDGAALFGLWTDAHTQAGWGAGGGRRGDAASSSPPSACCAIL